MARAINAILNLRDNMSGGLLRVARNTQGVTREMQSATRQVVRFGNRAKGAITDVMKSTTKWAAAAGGAMAVVAAKTGFSEAMDLEGYRTQLETATKDTVKAAKVMQYAVGLANKSPFENGEMVEAAAKFEAMGMSAESWLTRTGNMAGATNKSMDQAVEAVIDAQAGELERLKEFGIKKADILAQGEKLFADVQIVNNKGQIVNQEKFNEALISLMEDKFAGGMEKMAGTTRGIFSTITGIAKSGLAAILGMSADGTIQAGSAMDILKQKAQSLADQLQTWQQDGTIDRVSQRFTAGLTRIMDTGERALQWIRSNGEDIKGWIIGLGAALAVVKVVQFAANMVTAGRVLFQFGQVAMAFVAANPIVLAIGAAIAAGVALIANWDKVKTWAGNIRDQFVEKFTSIKESVVGAFDGIKTKVSEVFDWFGEKFRWLDEKVEGIPLLGGLYKGAKHGLAWLSDRQFGTNFTGMRDNQQGTTALQQLQHNALGTHYWRGGLTHINERGGEIVNLPGGTQIIPHDVSMQMAGGPRVTVNVTIQGNVIGNEAYAEEMGGIISRKLLWALKNV